MSRPRTFSRRLLALALAAVVLGGCLLGWLAWNRARNTPSVTYQLTDGKLEGSKAYGGAWSVVDGAVRNNSDERGAKLVTGSGEWKDYTLTADMKFDGEHGDMGVIVRSTEEEEGVDAYNGYYVGLRTTDATLIIGRSDHGWMEARPVPMPGGVHAGIWYRLVVTAVGCRIAASSENLTTLQTAWIAVEEPHCAFAGRIGLRSLATGGMWKNIGVRPAELSDYQALSSHAALIASPEFPKREADYNRIFRFSPSYDTAMQSPGAPEAPTERSLHTAELQNLPRSPDRLVSLRGVVTYVTSDLYIQDAEGGVFVEGAQMPRLNVGDEVEVTGHVEPGLYSSTIRDGTVRLLWGGTPTPPIAITPLQAASGAYDARFVELEGRLTGIRQPAPNEQVLEFSEDGQPFSAIYVNQSTGSLPRPEVNSRLRIRGVCVLDRKVTREIAPFVVLLRSVEDIQTIAPPPWWTPAHIVLLFIALIGCALLIQLIYFRIQAWQANAIAQERERLAHDIHDTMAQSFAGVGYQIQGIRSGVQRRDQPEFRRIASQLDVAYQLVRKSHEEASRTIAMLNAATPDIETDLAGALTRTAKKIAGNEMEVKTSTEGTPFRLNLRLTNALLHIGQEAIANAVSHANPATLAITVRYHEPCVELIVEDDGSGFDYTPETAGFGILGMQKRTQAVGGQLQIITASGRGTEIHVVAKSRPTTLRAKVLSKVAERFHVLTKWLWAA